MDVVISIYFLIAIGFALYLRGGRATVGGYALAGRRKRAALIWPVLVVEMIRENGASSKRIGGPSDDRGPHDHGGVGSGAPGEEREEESAGLKVEITKYGKIDDGD